MSPLSVETLGHWCKPRRTPGSPLFLQRRACTKGVPGLPATNRNGDLQAAELQEDFLAESVTHSSIIEALAESYAPFWMDGVQGTLGKENVMGSSHSTSPGGGIFRGAFVADPGSR